MQFKNRYGISNTFQENVSLEIKTRRIQYLLSHTQFDEPKQHFTEHDWAEFDFVNDMRIYSSRYLELSNILGINFGAILFFTAFKNLYWFS